MIKFEKKFFQKLVFTEEQISRYMNNALRDLKIAQEDSYAEVKFTYCYQALLKAGITLIAKEGGVKVRGIPGHHIKVLTKMSEILDDEDVFAVGNAMRMKRNLDFYGGGEFVSKKEISDWIKFTKDILKKVEKIVKA